MEGEDALLLPVGRIQAPLGSSVGRDRPTLSSLSSALRRFPSSLAPPHCFSCIHVPVHLGLDGSVVTGPAASVHPKAELPSE